MKVLNQYQGFIILAVYSLFIYGIIFITCRKKEEQTKSWFLLNNRKVSSIIGSFSVASAWIWAPALFVSAQKTYQQGLVGLFWFLVPNVLALALFGIFAVKVRERHPNGFTISEYMGRYSDRVHKYHLFELFAMDICAVAIQVLAGAGAISLVTGINFHLLTVILGLMALGYSFYGGYKASTISNTVQMLIMLVLMFIIIPTVLSKTGLAPLKAGLGGITGKYSNIFSKNGLEVMLTFGIGSTITLFSGPIGGQPYWQRAFSIEKSKDIIKTYIIASLIFAVVPLLMSLLGFIGAGSGMTNIDMQYINIAVILKYMSPLIIIPFLWILISGLLSTIDTGLCSTSSLVGHDIMNKFSYNKTRFMMILITIIGILIANIPGLKIAHLWLFYGMLRSTVALPTVFASLNIKMNEKGLFWGEMLGLISGAPTYLIGSFKNDWRLMLISAILAVGFPLISLINGKELSNE